MIEITHVSKTFNKGTINEKRALDDLCRAGFLVKESRWRENGSHSSNLYRIR